MVYVQPNKIKAGNAKYSQNNAFKVTVVSTVVSAVSVIASLVIALAIKNNSENAQYPSGIFLRVLRQRAGLVLAPHLLSFLDELCLLAFAVLAVVDMTFNRCFGKYKLMFVLLGVMALYLAYSLVASPYNIPKAQINDFIAQCKPLIAFQ